ncbi:MAG: hypothetical protein JF606_11585 [Burkholderiales bacterium]|jgi:Leucine-rich repeat (LRR) protein|nr:hypothetical protein [Burkholderiales bacterium]
MDMTRLIPQEPAQHCNRGAAFSPSSELPVLTDVVRADRLGAARHVSKLSDALAASPRNNGMLPMDAAGTMRLWNYEGTDLPSSLWQMRQVQTLDLSGSRQLERVSSSISGLSQLRDLVLSQCKSLKELPEELGLLEELRVLDLSKCSSLAVLPSSLGSLHQLQRLDLRGCDALTGLPTSISKLPRTCSVLLPKQLNRSAIDMAHPAGRPQDA